jgi:hypothetical protein
VPASANHGGPYAPYEFLVGDWNVGPEGTPPVLVMHVSWGPNRSFIRYAASLLTAKGEEPHFDGVLMWNGVSKKLDMLLMLDLSERAGAQESGTLSADADGTVVRDITASYARGANGATSHFRQTYRRLAPDKVETSIMRETPSGWVPTFPGSERFVMIRRPAT